MALSWGRCLRQELHENMLYIALIIGQYKNEPVILSSIRDLPSYARPPSLEGFSQNGSSPRKQYITMAATHSWQKRTRNCIMFNFCYHQFWDQSFWSHPYNLEWWHQPRIKVKPSRWSLGGITPVYNHQDWSPKNSHSGFTELFQGWKGKSRTNPQLHWKHSIYISINSFWVPLCQLITSAIFTVIYNYICCHKTHFIEGSSLQLFPPTTNNKNKTSPINSANTVDGKNPVNSPVEVGSLNPIIYDRF